MNNGRQLIPGEPIFPLCPGVDSRVADRLASVFRQTWERITTDREACPRMLGYWMKKREAGTLSPSVWLKNGVGRPRTTDRGHQLHFFAATVIELDDESMLDVAIAHELAHAVLYAAHDRDHWATVADGQNGLERGHRRLCLLAASGLAVKRAVRKNCVPSGKKVARNLRSVSATVRQWL